MALASLTLFHSCTINRIVESPRSAPISANSSYVKVMPVGHKIIEVDGLKYYTYNNRWYTYRRGRYVVVSRPINYRRGVRKRVRRAAVRHSRKH